jgi:hypothetical protein
VNFITGAGGLLQAVVFGYGGLRLQDNHLEVSVSSIVGTSAWAMYDLKYRGFTFDLRLVDDKLYITVTGTENQNKSLAVLFQDGFSYPLPTGNVKVVREKAFKLRVEENRTVVDNDSHNSVQSLESSVILVSLFNLIMILLHVL